MTEQIEVKPKNKGGRPRKEKKGAMIWCPDFCLDMVQAIIETAKQQQSRQQRTMARSPVQPLAASNQKVVPVCYNID
jgi:hypothetical protein